jgi:hypothetical protein
MVPQALAAGIGAPRHKSLHSLVFYCSGDPPDCGVVVEISLLEALTLISATTIKD